MKVILKEYVYKHGVAGDVIEVANGFARNFLIPRGLALPATPGALRQSHQLIVKAKENRARLMAMESEAAIKIDGVELVFGVKAGKNNKLYGSVTTREISELLLEKTGVEVNRRRISERPLRELGVHEVPVHMGSGAPPVLKVTIIREEEVAAYLAGQVVPSLIALGIQEAPPRPVTAEQEAPRGRRGGGRPGRGEAAGSAPVAEAVVAEAVVAEAVVAEAVVAEAVVAEAIDAEPVAVEAADVEAAADA